MTHTEQTLTPTERNWPAGGGEMGALIRSRDWSESPLGPLEEWPQSLRSALLEICLTSPTPISIYWGSDLILFYNNAWQKLLGERHPSALGSPAREVFADSWGAIQPMLEHVLSTGEAVESKNQILPLRVFGHKKGYFDISFSPISNKDGIFSIATESTDFVKLEKAFSENERGFREMVDALPAAIYTTDAEGRLTHFNPAAVEFSGREPELGTDQWCVTWKLYHTDGTPMPHEECPMAVALKEGRSVVGEQAIAERPDGKRVWFEPYPSPLRDSNGKIIGGINMLIDVTERKQAEKQLRRSERELADFFENATIGLHWVGPEGTILRANQAELDMLGYSREEYVRNHIADFHADQEVIDDILRRLKVGEELHDYQARLRCKDGSIRHVLISSNVLRENGEFIHTRCFTRDVTERKQAERALRENEQELTDLFENAPLGIHWMGPDGTILRANQADLDLLGYTREEYVGRNIADLHVAGR